FLVAITKMDLPAANPNQVKDQLARLGILVEGRGGEVVAIPVSAKTGEGIDDLLEMVILVAQMQELVDTKDKPFEGVVIESRLDRARGSVGTVLVKSGVLNLRDEIWVGPVSCRVRAMEDENGKQLEQAEPSQAVLVLGFSAVPTVGDRVVAKPVEDKACAKIDKVLGSKIDPKKVSLIIKADTQGTLEAVLGGLPKKIQIIDCGVGGVTISDVLLAQTTGASVQGFNVRVSGLVKKLAKIEKVTVKTYRIIYELFDEVIRLVEMRKKPKKKEEIVGRAMVVKKFLVSGQEIAGGEVVKGRLAVGDSVRLERNGKVVGSAKLSSLHQGREKKEKIKAEEEFGAVFLPQLDFKSGDVILSVLNLPEKK
ncbi:translation initiation factor IF-2, partial [Patescibacteria group bacterium]|nr:translation initiation factor IF-2 [Patescibacteria group bacterium]